MVNSSNNAAISTAVPDTAGSSPALRSISYMAPAIIFVGIVLRLLITLPTDLWEDEIIAVTHAMQPGWAIFVDTIRNDIHPPLYFFQLHAWSLIAASDLWFMANSMLWSLFGLVSLYWVVSRHWGRTVGLASTAIYAVMPSPVYMADQVRMYAMLAVLLIWTLHFAILVFKDRDEKIWSYAALMMLQFALVLTHALGALAVACFGIYTLLFCRVNGAGYRKWLVCYGLTAVVALPWLLNTAAHDGNVQRTTNLRGLVLMLSSSTVGISAIVSPIEKAAGILIFACMVLIASVEKDSRRIALCFTVLPLAIAFLGNIVQPFFKWNFFSTLQAPFIALILGLALSRRNALKSVLAACCLILFLAVSLESRLHFRESSKFLAASNFIRMNYHPGDVIFVPQQSYFHGLAWYLDGPYWGSPLKIAPPPTTPWKKVYMRLGPTIVQKLDLMPVKAIIDDKPFKILTGTMPSKDAPDARRFWLVSIRRADLPKDYPPRTIGDLKKQFTAGKSVQISLYAERPQTVLGSAGNL